MTVDLTAARTLARQVDASGALPSLAERGRLTDEIRRLAAELEAARAELCALRPVVVAALAYHAAYCIDPFSPRALDARDQLFRALVNPLA